MKQEIQNKIDQLKKQLNELEAELKKPNKWQPKGGIWHIRMDGVIGCAPADKKYAEFGTERNTREAAENASRAMRVFNRLLAYRDEFFPEWAEYKGDLYFVDQKYNIFGNPAWEYYKTGGKQVTHFNGRVLFSISVAEELVRKLNSGEVEL